MLKLFKSLTQSKRDTTSPVLMDTKTFHQLTSISNYTTMLTKHTNNNVLLTWISQTGSNRLPLSTMKYPARTSAELRDPFTPLMVCLRSTPDGVPITCSTLPVASMRAYAYAHQRGIKKLWVEVLFAIDTRKYLRASNEVSWPATGVVEPLKKVWPTLMARLHKLVRTYHSNNVLTCWQCWC